MGPSFCLCSTTMFGRPRRQDSGSFDQAYPMQSQCRCWAIGKLQGISLGLGKWDSQSGLRSPWVCKESETMLFSGSWKPRHGWDLQKR